MKKTISSADHIIQLLLAVTVVILWYTNVINGTVVMALLVFAGIFIFTSFIGLCPLYTLLGKNTCQRRTNQSSI